MINILSILINSYTYFNYKITEIITILYIQFVYFYIIIIGTLRTIKLWIRILISE